MKKIFVLSVLIFHLLPGFSQSPDLTKDEDFFRSRIKLFQKWLDQSNLGLYLKVHDLSVEPQNLSVYLSFPFEATDSVSQTWKLLKSKFDKASMITLEQELFYRMVNIFEVPQKFASIQMYDTYDLRKEPLFFRGIRCNEDGEVLVEESNPKANINSSIIDIYFNYIKNGIIQNLNSKYDQKPLYSKIQKCVQSYYSAKNSKQSPIKVVVLENKNTLRLEITTLLDESSLEPLSPLLCKSLQTLDKDCNWAKHVVLSFIILYVNNTSGAKIKVELVGKIGATDFAKSKRGDFINMDIGFDNYLNLYAKEISEYIAECITKP